MSTNRITPFTILGILFLALVGLGSRFWVAYESKQDFKKVRKTMEEIQKSEAEFRKEMAKPLVAEE